MNIVQGESVVNVKKVPQLEEIYSKRKSEMDEVKGNINKLKGNMENEAQNFSKAYALIDVDKLKAFGLRLDADLTDMTTKQLIDFKSKLEEVYESVYDSLEHYLNHYEIKDPLSIFFSKEANKEGGSGHTETVNEIYGRV